MPRLPIVFELSPLNLYFVYDETTQKSYLFVMIEVSEKEKEYLNEPLLFQIKEGIPPPQRKITNPQ